MDSKGKRYCTTRQETNISNVLNVFERLFNVFIIIRCVELIMYNEHVVSFRQKTLEHCSFAAAYQQFLLAAA